jgi:nitrite reductase (NADH) small subunit
VKNFIPVCKLEDIQPLGARRYRRDDGTQIAVFRTATDSVFALLDRCPHKGGPLSQGIVFGEAVACPLHNWCIGLRNGSAAAPDTGYVERFAVRIVDGQVELDPWSGEKALAACSAAVAE